MSRSTITSTQLESHVEKLGNEHPPIPMESVDFTINRPDMVRERYGVMFDYLARVELEVARNVKELDAILPSAPDVDRAFYRGVWYDQELQHGLILDRVVGLLGMPSAQPLTEVGGSIRLLGAASRIQAIQDVARCVYYFTGASTERQAVLAYNALVDQLQDLDEDALVETVIAPIKRQEPGHFAFYTMSATKVVDELSPWQLYLARQLRSRSYELVGTHRDPKYQAQMGRVSEILGFANNPEGYAREIGRLEARLLWANDNGMEFPPYVLEAIVESLRLAAEERAAQSDSMAA